jgi:hypothetical protein
MWCTAVLTRATCLLAICAAPASVYAQQPAPPRQDTRTQYPAFLVDSYVGLTIGFLDDPFSQAQLEAGFHAGSVASPHLAARVAVFGHEFGRHVAVQGTYMRSVRFVTYKDVNADAGAHHVWTGFAGATLKGRVPIATRASLYGEGGLGITSRHGFTREEAPVVRDATYASTLVGAGLDYRLRPTWTLTAGVTYSPPRARDREPRALLASAGFQYTMRALPEERVEAIERASAIFPHNHVQLEYTTAYGYGITNFVSKTVPIFWSGNVDVDRGLAAHYDRNVFHTARIFALDFGVSAAGWRSQGHRDRFSTLSVYPLLRFTLVRTRQADLYVCYSLAGPTYVSKVVIDSRDTGAHFTFQDFMGAGAFVGPNRRVSVGVKINHYSNGNLFSQNAAVTIPLTVTVGYTF